MTAAATFEAEIIAAFGRHLRVRDAAGCEFEARPHGRRLVLACGDRVLCKHVDVSSQEIIGMSIVGAEEALRWTLLQERKQCIEVLGGGAFAKRNLLSCFAFL